MSLNSTLSIQDLHKRYGKIHAVNGLSLDVEEGSVFGILGPNGSGKSTTLGILLDVVTKDSGTFQWFGQPPSTEVRKQIGAILETPTFYPYLSAVQNLKVVATIKSVDHKRIEQVLKTVGLLERKDDAFRHYSLGMKQRLAIASALLADPQVMILDEPTNGLDPQGIAEIRQLIIEIAGRGKTIILASHLLDEVQKVCSHFAILKRGKKIYSGSVAEVLHGSDTVEVAATDMEQLQKIAAEFPHTKAIVRENGHLKLQLDQGQNSGDLNRYLVEKGMIISHLRQQTKSLEKQFLELLASSHE
ncbi:ABC-type multidrug transport system ATPase subunit [Catalinimonas alkaloidigena]|uniref:ABC transporter ATP-binding protein n=1 Tax=Catalinimonas alkaloidigena TaxID=1075417 RepID=UPI0024056902|nr:ATP-binding cassette domain-containing protein [Catalinimonas alkaloidigena]MDF9796156.1 ABC-type multidrug transport system ATPase subunit [Catalinimonas alkaloidigena]